MTMETLNCPQESLFFSLTNLFLFFFKASNFSQAFNVWPLFLFYSYTRLWISSTRTSSSSSNKKNKKIPISPENQRPCSQMSAAISLR
ncbi:hypothetical protein L2E82_24995 [Cichorium intybus]|uniref:Uncharacterized protein n=1 Tax=Cichorium intybus TaxID=13427 RepID=A0ACB9E3A6_CICIN|nr:hypothetical protein L2E82_24995 [Cichorium intybus]